jgi:hypothetical protein
MNARLVTKNPVIACVAHGAIGAHPEKTRLPALKQPIVGCTLAVL